MAVLLAPTLLSGMQATTWGLMATVVAAASQSIGLVYGRKYLVGLPPLVGPTGQLTMSTLYLLPLSLIVERPYTIATPSAMALGAVLTLAIMSTALTYVIFYRVMEQTSATNLSLVTYMVPLVATVLGVVVLHERLAWTTYLGGFLIIIGIMVVNGIFRISSRWRLARPGAPKDPQITPCA